MDIEILKDAPRVIGIKQVTKEIRRGSVASLFVGSDAEPCVTRELIEMAEEEDLPLEQSHTMAELGRACGIAVKAAAAAVIKPR